MDSRLANNIRDVDEPLLYSHTIISGCLCLIVRFTNPSILFAFWYDSQQRFAGFKSLEICTPRSCSCHFIKFTALHTITKLIVSVPNVHSYTLGDAELHLPCLRPVAQFTVFKLSCNCCLSATLLTFANTLVSSANLSNMLLILLSISFTKIKNNNGPRTGYHSIPVPIQADPL